MFVGFTHQGAHTSPLDRHAWWKQEDDNEMMAVDVAQEEIPTNPPGADEDHTICHSGIRSEIESTGPYSIKDTVLYSHTLMQPKTGG